MKSVAMSLSKKCPVCHHSFQLPQKIKVTEVTKCPKCRTLLEVVSITPTILSKVK